MNLQDLIKISEKVIRAVKQEARGRVMTENEKAEVAWHENRIDRFTLRLRVLDRA